MEVTTMLLELYRSAHGLGVGEFEEYALSLTRRVLGFDTAIWGAGLLFQNGRVAPHAVHMHRQPQESIKRWANLNVMDPVAKLCMSQPGRSIRFHAPTLFAKKSASPMRDYASRYGRQSYMVCGVRVDGQTEMMAWLSLYRKNPDAQYTIAEQAVFSQLMAHLHQAQNMSRAIQLHQTFDDSGSDLRDALAICDRKGYFLAGSNVAIEQIKREWLSTKGTRLPESVVESLKGTSNACFVGRATCVQSKMVGDLCFLRVRPRTAMDSLSERELQVATAVARGWSAKVIAKEHGIAPSTVRVHLQHIYEKLGIHSQAELAALVAVRAPKPTLAGLPAIREAG